MSASYIPVEVRLRLWGKSAGRCQYSGCNQPLWRDDLTKAEFNTSYIAHLYDQNSKLGGFVPALDIGDFSRVKEVEP